MTTPDARVIRLAARIDEDLARADAFTFAAIAAGDVTIAQANAWIDRNLEDVRAAHALKLEGLDVAPLRAPIKALNLLVAAVQATLERELVPGVSGAIHRCGDAEVVYVLEREQTADVRAYDSLPANMQTAIAGVAWPKSWPERWLVYERADGRVTLHEMMARPTELHA